MSYVFATYALRMRYVCASYALRMRFLCAAGSLQMSLPMPNECATKMLTLRVERRPLQIASPTARCVPQKGSARRNRQQC